VKPFKTQSKLHLEGNLQFGPLNSDSSNLDSNSGSTVGQLNDGNQSQRLDSRAVKCQFKVLFFTFMFIERMRKSGNIIKYFNLS